MNNLLSSWKCRSPMFWMLVFIALFYSGSFLTERLSGPDRRHGIQKAQKVSAQEIDRREKRFQENLSAHPEWAVTMGWFFILALGGGLGLDFYFLARKMKKKPPLVRGRALSETGWGLRDLLGVFIVLLFLEICLLLLETAAMSFFNFRMMERGFWTMANSFLRDLAGALWVIFLVKRKFGKPLASIGLGSENFLRDIGTGLVGYAAIVPALVAVLLILSVTAKFFSYEPPPQAVVEIYLHETKADAIVFFTFFTAIAGPIIEEILFRGFAYHAFRRSVGARGAAAATAAIFAAVHLSPIAFVPIFILGVFLAALYEKTGSLVPSITAHMAHNLVMVTFTLAFKSLSG